MKNIYIVNTCDVWKSYSSMEKQIVTTSWRKAYKKVLELIKENEYEVGNEWMLDRCKNYPCDYNDINNVVANIYVEIWED